MGISVTDLKNAFGKAVSNQATRSDIDKAFLVPSVTDVEFNLVPTNFTQVRRVKSSVDQVLQAFQAQLTPAGTVLLEPRSIDLQDLKYELELDPDVIEDSYLGFMSNPDNNDRKSWTIVQYIINELMIGKGRENFELFEAYKGVKAAITPGTATTLGQQFNGLGKLIADNISDYSLVAGPAGWATDPKDFVTEIEEWVESCRATSEVNRTIIDNVVDRIHMSQTLAQRFKTGMKEKYNVNYARVSDPMMVETAPNIMVKGLPSMSSRERVVMSFKANRGAYIKRPTSESRVDINDANPYKPTAYAKFWKGIGFWHPEYTFVNQLV